MWFTVRRINHGGQHKVYPGKLRITLIIQLILQAFFMITILQAGGIITLWFSYKVTRIICIVMAVYLSLNVFVNAISKSKKERYIITPLSLLTAGVNSG